MGAQKGDISYVATPGKITMINYKKMVDKAHLQCLLKFRMNSSAYAGTEFMVTKREWSKRNGEFEKQLFKIKY